MVNPFDAARDVIFDQPARPVDAGYREAEDAVPLEGTVRVILGFTQPSAGLLETGARPGGNRLWVRETDFPERPPEGSIFSIGSREFRTRNVERSADGRWWLVDVDEIDSGS